MCENNAPKKEMVEGMKKFAFLVQRLVLTSLLLLNFALLCFVFHCVCVEYVYFFFLFAECYTNLTASNQPRTENIKCGLKHLWKVKSG